MGIYTYKTMYMQIKADPAPARAPLFEFFFFGGGVVFVNFDCITRIYFNCIHHTIFVLYSNYET